jgi:hypothetical protein
MLSSADERDESMPNLKNGFFLPLLLLAGCSSTTDGPSEGPTLKQAAMVRIVDTVPEKTERFSNLSSTVCRDKAQPVPATRDGALLLLKLRALQNGYLTIHSVTVGRVEGSLADDCAGGIQARGIGYTAAK